MAEPRDSSSTTRRRDHYNSQRTSSSRPGTSNTQYRASYQGYREPDTFRNLDEAAVSPPIANREDAEYYTRPSPLEKNISDPDRRVDGGRVPSRRHERSASHTSRPQRRSSVDDPYELTEVAGPPPVQRDAPGESSSESTERQRYLEDEEQAAGHEESRETVGPYRPRTPAEYAHHETKETPKWLTEVCTLSYLIFFSIWGTLARLGVQWITWYPGTPIATPVIWANFAGSLIMGFLAEDQALFRMSTPNDPDTINHTNGFAHATPKPEDKPAHAKRKKTIPLYIGLATGFCGSFTSFSSFARDAFLALANDLPTPITHPTTTPPPTPALIATTLPRNGGYSFQAWLHTVLATLALSLSGLMAGAHLAIFAARRTPRIHGSFVQRVLDPAMVVLGPGCWLGAVLLAIFPPHNAWRGTVLFALVLAPPGCLLRFYLALKLNALVPSFPLGTFAANMLGTAVEGMSFDLQHVGIGVGGSVGGGGTGCQVLQGTMDGFCGCATTVSTWVAEINGLRRSHGWVYAGASVVGGLGLMVVVMGSVRWSVGWSEPVCATGYTGKVNG